MSLIRTLNTAVTGLLAHQLKMDVISNNIANVNTTAFKAQRATFQDLLSSTLKVALGPRGTIGGTNPNQVGMGVQLGSIDTFMQQGTLETTGRPTDIAIQGDGFFIESKDGRNQLFTRDGNFSLDSSKEFVDSATGYAIQGWNVGNNSTNPDPFAIDTSLPTLGINLPIGVKKMARATTSVQYASNLNADSVVRQPNFSYMRVRPRGSSDWQTVKFKWTEINDINGGEHRWEWFAQVVGGGGSLAGPNTGAISFNDGGQVIANTQTNVIVRDSNGNQVRLLIAPDKYQVGVGVNPTRVLSHMNVREWQLAPAAATALRRTYELDDFGAGVNADRNILVAVDPEDIRPTSTADGDPTNDDPYFSTGEAGTAVSNADGIPLEGMFVNTNNWAEGGWESDLVIVPEWRLAVASSTAEVDPDDQHFHYVRLAFYKGSKPGTVDAQGAPSATLTNENTIKDPNNNTTADLAHRTDPNYWTYKFEVVRSDNSDGLGRNSLLAAAGLNDAVLPGALPAAATLQLSNNGSAFAAVANARASKTLLFSDTGYVSGGDGTSGRAAFRLFDDDLVTFRTITPPLANTGPDPLTFALDSGQDPNLTGVFDNGDVYRNSVQVYDSLGSAHNYTVKYTKAGVNVWDGVVALPENDNAQNSLTGNYLNLNFNSTGQRPTVTFDNVTQLTLAPSAVSFLPAGANTVTINPNFTQATQFGGENTMKAISQDGFPMGVLQTFVIENSGAITGVYENGLRSTEAQLAMAMFRNPEGLTRVGNNIFKQSPNSGIVIQGTPDTNGFGQTFGGELEASNVDLAVEFTNLIITQRGFQANTRSVTTADEMVQDVIAMKR